MKRKRTTEPKTTTKAETQDTIQQDRKKQAQEASKKYEEGGKLNKSQMAASQAKEKKAKEKAGLELTRAYRLKGLTEKENLECLQAARKLSRENSDLDENFVDVCEKMHSELQRLQTVIYHVRLNDYLERFYHKDFQVKKEMLTEENLMVLLNAMQHNPNLELDDILFEHIEISLEAAKILAMVLKNMARGISLLTLHGCHLYNEGISILANALSNCRIQHLSIGANYLTGPGLALLGDVLKNNASIETLDVGDSDVVFLDGEEDDDDDNRILGANFQSAQPDEILRFSTGLQRSSLTFLDLSQSKINLESLVTLAEHGLKNNQRLKTLQLTRTTLHLEGAKILANALVNNIVLEHLILHRCKIGNAGAAYFAKIIKSDISLGALDLDNSIGKKIRKEIKKGLEINYSQRLNWGIASILTAFVRANPIHPFRYSIKPLLETMLCYYRRHTLPLFYHRLQRERKTPFQVEKFIDTKYFKAHVAPSREGPF